MTKTKPENLGMSEAEFERQFQDATKRGKESLKSLPKAMSAKYDQDSKRLILNLKNGVILMIPVRLIQGLQTDDEKALSDFDLMLEGSQIHWHRLDTQFYIKSLIEGVFGTQNWMNNLSEHLASIGAKGGAAKSPAKSKSSRENGMKGGRPKREKAA